MNPDQIVREPNSGETIEQVITNLGTNTINLILYFAGAIAIGFLVYNGIRLIQSQGNEEQIGKAKKSITYSIIGIVLITLSLIIANSLVGFVDTAI